MKIHHVLFSIFFCKVLVLCSLSVSANDLEWPVLRHDYDRTGRSSGQGNINTPVVVDSIPVGSTMSENAFWAADVNLDGSLEYAFIEGGRVVLRSQSRHVLWSTRAISAKNILALDDFDGSGTLEYLVINSDNSANFVFLDALTGDILWSATGIAPDGSRISSGQMTIDDITNDNLPDVVLSPWGDENLYAFTFADGFKTDPTHNIFWIYVKIGYKNLVVPQIGDIDGDGSKEVVFTQYQELSVLNANDGTLLSYFDNLFASFSFGLIELANVDSDPQLEIISVANSHHNIAVTVVDAVDEIVQWQYQWYPPDTKNAKFVSDAIVDIDSDGEVEIIFSVYNNQDDEITNPDSTPGNYDGIYLPDQWVTLVFNGANGVVEHAIPNTQISAIINDENPVLILRQMDAGILESSAFGSIQMLRWIEGIPKIIFDMTSASVMNINNYSAGILNSNSRRAFSGNADLNNNGKTEIFIAKDKNHDGNQDEIEAFENSQTGIVSAFTIPLHTVGLSSLRLTNIEILPVFVPSTGTLNIYGQDGQAYVSFPVLGKPSQPLAFEMSSTPGVELLLKTAANELVFYNSHTQGVISDVYTSFEGVNDTRFLASGDINSDGMNELFLGERVDINSVNFGLYTADANIPVWQRKFSNLNPSVGQALFANVSGAENTRDVVLLFQDDSLQDEEDLRLVALSSSDGSTLWDISLRPTNKSINPLLNIVDINEDKSDDILVVDTSAIIYVNGATGEQTIFRYKRFARSIVVTDLIGDGKDDVLMVNHEEANGFELYPLLNGTPIWNIPHEYYFEVHYLAPAIFKHLDSIGFIKTTAHGSIQGFDGFGQPYTDELYLNGGSIHYSEVGGNTLSSPVVADINGDGHEDLLIGTADGYLMAIDIITETLLWSLDLNNHVYEPILTDTDGDGLLEIVVGTADSSLKVIDQQGFDPVLEVRDVAVSCNGVITNPQVDIDTTSMRHLYGVSWTPVPNAQYYTVTIVDDNEVPIIDTVTTSDSQIALSTAPRLFNHLYRAIVITHFDKGVVSVPTVSDGLTLIDDTPPVIKKLKLHPKSLNLGYGKILVSVFATDNSSLSSVSMEIINSKGEVIYFSKGVLSDFRDSYTFIYKGDGVIGKDRLLARVTVHDAAGNSISSQQRFRVTRSFGRKIYLFGWSLFSKIRRFLFG